MKKSVLLILAVLGIIILSILSYIVIPKNISGNKYSGQAAVIQAIEYNSHLPTDVFLDRIKEPNMTIVDIRTPEEYTSGHIDKAINIDFYASDFKDQFEKLNKSEAYSIYCRSGSRSGKALGIMKGLGFKNVADLQGGYSSLSK
jgi:rhodanese-related sulfurtransferase